jgi:hypothetical protein
VASGAGAIGTGDTLNAAAAPSSGSSQAPKDKYNLVYIMFCLLGVGALAPWVFFNTPSSYWMYKFRDIKATDPFDPKIKTDLQKSFLSYLSLVATLSATLFLFVNVLFCQK